MNEGIEGRLGNSCRSSNVGRMKVCGSGEDIAQWKIDVQHAHAHAVERHRPASQPAGAHIDLVIAASKGGHQEGKRIDFDIDRMGRVEASLDRPRRDALRNELGAEIQRHQKPDHDQDPDHSPHGASEARPGPIGFYDDPRPYYRCMSGYPLEPDRRQMEEIGRAALDLVIRFIEDRATAPAVDVDGAYELASELRSSPPAEGGDLQELLTTVRAAADKAFDAAGPGYLAYIPGGGLYTSAVAEMISRSLNRFTNLAAPAPALVQLEANVCRWLCDLFSLPETSQGILTTGGSMANFGAVVTARTARARDDFRATRIYVSDQVHHSMAKAARIAGFPEDAVRQIATDEDLRMDAAALRTAIAEDRRDGRPPLMIVANAGTTNTGVVDNLQELAGVARDENVWLHVDAAYGGFFRLTDRGRTTLSGIEEADSLSLDPHKAMFLGYGTGSLLVRDGALLKEAHQVGASYLPHATDDAAIPDFADYTPELSRDYRGLRVWMPLWLHGVNAFRDALDEKLDLTESVYEALKQTAGLDVPWKPDLTVVGFRPSEGGDRAALKLLDAINDSKRIFISSTVVGGHLTLRVCIVSHRTHRDRIDEGIEIIQKAVADL